MDLAFLTMVRLKTSSTHSLNSFADWPQVKANSYRPNGAWCRTYRTRSGAIASCAKRLSKSVTDNVPQVVVLRLIASAHVRTNAESFAPFLMDPQTFEPMEPDSFCRTEVEPCGREADHVQILALSQALGVHLRICYLDRSEITGGEANWVDFGPEEAMDAAEEEKIKGRPLTLLYR